MANNMDSFDFDALDSAALDETLSFLNNYHPTSLPDPSLEGFGNFGGPDENPSWGPHGNAELAGGVTDALTDSSLLGSTFPNPGWGVQSGPYQQRQTMEAETPLNFDESGLCRGKRPASEKTLGHLSAIRESSLLGPKHDVSDLEGSYQSMDEKFLPRLCNWPSCKSVTLYGTIRDLQNHQTDVHVAAILKGWPGSCSWPGCNSKIFFKTSNRLESHVYNVHITPLCCTVAGCRHKRPFERQADLERHVASRHTDQRKYRCPYPRCEYTCTFSRKDKLKQHERTYHGQFACQLNHCIYGFLSKEKLQKHDSNYSVHGNYECHLGSCGSTEASRFSRYTTLWWHLEDDHMIPSKAASQAIEKLKYSNRTLTSAHFPDGFSDFRDCEGCIKKLKEAASGKEEKEEK